MPLAAMQGVLAHALRHGYAVGYFESWDLYSLEGALEAAEATRSPAIIGFGGAVTNPAWLEQNGIEALASLSICLAQRATVPTAVIFNEAQTFEQAIRGLKAGCNALMVDSSNLPPAQHQEVTARLATAAHAVGVAVEANWAISPMPRIPRIMQPPTDPADAAAFVAATGIDALAVAIGNVHLLAQGEATVDLDLLARIHAATPVPLVIHGGTGFPRAAIRDAIRHGVAKFNIGTMLKQAFFDGVRDAANQPATPGSTIHDRIGSRDSADIQLQGKERMKSKILELIERYGSAGMADRW
ncbi:MAG: class II fructose-bisphosphate aldolase [Anaerolineales bacterium]|nr:class II fructose-bisphosphate aldolase [Anaerolineales bacterium]